MTTPQLPAVTPPTAPALTYLPNPHRTLLRKLLDGHKLKGTRIYPRDWSWKLTPPDDGMHVDVSESSLCVLVERGVARLRSGPMEGGYEVHLVEVEEVRAKALLAVPRPPSVDPDQLDWTRPGGAA